MAHALEIRGPGEASFAYRAQGGPPWHGLGTPVDGHMSAEEILRLAHADYEVIKQPTFAPHPTRIYSYMVLDEHVEHPHLVEVPERFVTGRVEANGDFTPWEVVKGRYAIVQNELVLDKALAVVGASHGDAVMDTCGVLNDGRKFFATIDLGQVIIDPAGVNDVISRFLVVATSHDGTSPIVYANTDIRAVCDNTVRMGQMLAASTFTARHTTNVEGKLDEAGKVLGISANWAKAFAEEAIALLAIPVQSRDIDKVLNDVWPVSQADTDRKRDNRDAKVVSVRSRYGSPKNSAGFGHNGWSLLNAIGEHLDHGRTVSTATAAQDSFEQANLVHRTKLAAHGSIRNLV
jgi:phage/plasmid-like protein (TIGR03299 family)